MFSQGLFVKVVKSQDCVVKDQTDPLLYDDQLGLTHYEDKLNTLLQKLSLIFCRDIIIKKEHSIAPFLVTTRHMQRQRNFTKTKKHTKEDIFMPQH